MATNAKAKGDVRAAMTDALVSGQLNQGGTNIALNYLTQGEWSNGSILDPRVPDEDSAPALPDIDSWREQWKADPGNKDLRGPSGETLPGLAVSWDYSGRPFYGDGMTGWMKGFFSRLVIPFEDTSADEIKTEQANQKLAAFLSSVNTRIGKISEGDVLGAIPGAS